MKPSVLGIRTSAWAKGIHLRRENSRLTATLLVFQRPKFPINQSINRIVQIDEERDIITLYKVGYAGLVEGSKVMNSLHQTKVQKCVGRSCILRWNWAFGVQLLFQAAQIRVQIKFAEAAAVSLWLGTVCVLRRLRTQFGQNAFPGASPVLAVCLKLHQINKCNLINR